MPFIRYSLLFILLFSPFFNGSKDPVSVFVLETLIFFIFFRFIKFSTVRKTPIDVPVFLFFTLALFSLITTLYLNSSLTMLTMLLSFCILFYITISVYDDRLQKHLYTGLIITSVIISLTIIVQTFIGKIPKATFPNPNLAAGYIACGATLVFSFLFTGEKKLMQKTICFTLFLIFLTAIILTYSRGGIFSLFCGVSVIIFLKFKKRGILILAAAVLTAFILLPGKTIADITKTDGGDAYVNKRMEIWKSAVDIIREKPTLGTGPDNFSFLFHKYNFPVSEQLTRYGKSTRFVHNEFLQIAAEGGIFILAVFIWMLIIIFKNGFKTSSMSTAVLSAAIGHSFVDFNLHLPATMILAIFFTGDILHKKCTDNFELNPKQIQIVLTILFIFNTFNFFYKPFDAEKYKKIADEFIAGQPGRALEIYKKLIRYSPNDFEYRRTIGELYYTAGDRIGAIENLRKSIKLNPKNPFTLMSLANIYYDAEEYDKSKSYILEAINTEPNYLTAKYFLAKIDEKQKRYRDALIRYTEIISTSGLFKDTRLSSGYEKTLLYIDMSAVYNSLGFLYMNTGKLQDAILSYNTAVGINPSNAEAHSNLASAYFMKKDYKTALKHAELAAHYENTEPLHLKNLILIYRKLGNEKEIAVLENRISKMKPRMDTNGHELEIKN